MGRLEGNANRQGKLTRLLSVGGTGEIAITVSHYHAGERSRVRLIRGRIAKP